MSNENSSLFLDQKNSKGVIYNKFDIITFFFSYCGNARFKMEKDRKLQDFNNKNNKF